MSHATMPGLPGLAPVIAKHARVLARQLPRAIAGEPSAVHRARVASRRLREALPLAGEGGTIDDVGRDLRRVTRALGVVRELDVTLAVLKAEAGRQGWPVTTVSQLIRHIETEREQGRQKMADRLARTGARHLRSRALAIAEPLVTTSHRWESALGDRIIARAHALGETAGAVGALYVPERLHAARISAKKLRYSLELARDGAALPVARDIRALTQVQDLLGHLHDLQILRTEVQMAAGRARSRPLRVIVDACDAECRALHAQFLLRLPTLLALCDRVAARAKLIKRPMIRVSPDRAFAAPHEKRAVAARRA